MWHVVNQCIAAGLVKPHIDAAVDGTQVRANVSIHSLEEIQLEPVESIDDYLARQAKEDESEATEQPKPDKKGPPTPPSSGGKPGLAEQAVHEDFHGKSFSNQTHRSTSDPDARLYKKSNGQEAHPRYLVHDLVDVRSGVILDRRASRAAGTAEREVSLKQIAAIRFRHPRFGC
jgi:hypothetical protein